MITENHSFDYMDLCTQSNVSAFQYSGQVCHGFPSKEQASFNFMAAAKMDYSSKVTLECSQLSNTENNKMETVSSKV